MARHKEKYNSVFKKSVFCIEQYCIFADVAHKTRMCESRNISPWKPRGMLKNTAFPRDYWLHISQEQLKQWVRSATCDCPCLLGTSLCCLWSKVINRYSFHKTHVYLDAPSRERWSHFATICSILHALRVWIRLVSKSSIYLKAIEITGKQSNKRLKKSRHCSELPTPIHNFLVIKRSIGTLGRPRALTEDVNIWKTYYDSSCPVFPA